MNAGMRSAGCCPSESIVSTCVKPSAAAILMPCSTALPLPWLRASTTTRSPSSSFAIACSASAVPSSLPSTTTQTGDQNRRAPRTVSKAFGPGL